MFKNILFKLMNKANIQESFAFNNKSLNFKPLNL